MSNIANSYVKDFLALCEREGKKKYICPRISEGKCNEHSGYCGHATSHTKYGWCTDTGKGHGTNLCAVHCVCIEEEFFTEEDFNV